MQELRPEGSGKEWGRGRNVIRVAYSCCVLDKSFDESRSDSFPHLCSLPHLSYLSLPHAHLATGPLSEHGGAPLLHTSDPQNRLEWLREVDLWGWTVEILEAQHETTTAVHGRETCKRRRSNESLR